MKLQAYFSPAQVLCCSFNQTMSWYVMMNVINSMCVYNGYSVRDASLSKCFLHNSLKKRELKRQIKVELSPNRAQQPDPVNGQSTQRARSREKQGGRGSPPPLNRPFSLPLDPKVTIDDRSTSPSKSSLQRYRDAEGIKKKAERWKERQSDDSSPETRRRLDNRKDDFK